MSSAMTQTHRCGKRGDSPVTWHSATIKGQPKATEAKPMTGDRSGEAET